MSVSSPSSYPSAGEVIDGKYRIERVLGEGGMGAVMAAYHVILKSHVALKFISPDVLRVPGAVERFMNEGVAARGIQSDHIVRVDDVGILPSGLPYLVMEMLQGCDLSELVEREAPSGLPIPRAIHFVLQILRGLHVAHSKGVIHRDLKPANAFVIQRDGESDFIKLLDFGISKISQEPGKEAQQLTQTNTGLGTPLYMSPEQARNAREATPRSDLYSVSAILYELLTGRTPYQAESPNDLLFKLFTAEPDPILSVRSDLPPGARRPDPPGPLQGPRVSPVLGPRVRRASGPLRGRPIHRDRRPDRAVAGGIPRQRAPRRGRGAARRCCPPSRPSTVPQALPGRSPAGEVSSARTALSSSQSTQLGMGGDAPAPHGALGLSAKVALGVGVLAIVAGSAVLLTRPPAPTPGAGLAASDILRDPRGPRKSPRPPRPRPPRSPRSRWCPPRPPRPPRSAPRFLPHPARWGPPSRRPPARKTPSVWASSS
jgi:serine/threonine protein kinase